MKKEIPKPVVKCVETPPKGIFSNENYFRFYNFVEKSFAGMKKGFLNSSSTSKPTSTELIEISRKKPEQTKDFRVFDEVQQVMKDEEQSKSLTCFFFDFKSHEKC